MKRSAPSADLQALAQGRHSDPFKLLGPHLALDGQHVVVRTVQPAAQQVGVYLPAADEVVPMRRELDGVFEATLAGDHIPDYRLRVRFSGDHTLDFDDPYRYGRVLTDFDLYLFNEGTQFRIQEKLGSHRIRLGAATGVHFAVWAPNAQR